jgi:hypothetical protein
MSVTLPNGDGVITITPTGACTFNGTGGKPGARVTFVITTSGASSFVLTWGTNFKADGDARDRNDERKGLRGQLRL